MNITLIGYRGCGKSTVASLLAERLGWTSLDSDDVIEDRAGRSIREIFEQDGEATFRALEVQVLRDLLTDRDNLVLAAGGGAILAAENRERMQAAGPVIWLQAEASTLAQRIAGDDSSDLRRPGLTGRSAVAEVADVLTARLPLYTAAATLTVDADQQTPQQIVEQIVVQLGQDLTTGPRH